MEYSTPPLSSTASVALDLTLPWILHGLLEGSRGSIMDIRAQNSSMARAPLCFVPDRFIGMCKPSVEGECLSLGMVRSPIRELDAVYALDRKPVHRILRFRRTEKVSTIFVPIASLQS